MAEDTTNTSSSFDPSKALSLSSFDEQKQFFEQNKSIFEQTGQFKDLQTAFNFATDPTTSADDLARLQGDFSNIFGKAAQNLSGTIGETQNKLAEGFTNFAQRFDFSQLSPEEAQREISVLQNSENYQAELQDFRDKIASLKAYGIDTSEFEQNLAALEGRFGGTAEELAGTQFTPEGAVQDPNTGEFFTQDAFNQMQSDAQALEAQRNRTVGRLGEQVRIVQAEDGTYQIVGANTGTVFRDGLADASMANAVATRLQSGSEGDISGKPGVAATLLSVNELDASALAQIQATEPEKLQKPTRDQFEDETAYQTALEQFNRFGHWVDGGLVETNERLEQARMEREGDIQPMEETDLDVDVPDVFGSDFLDDALGANVGNGDIAGMLAQMQEAQAETIRALQPQTVGELKRELLDVQNQMEEILVGMQRGINNISDQPIEMQFITGQAASVERRAQTQLQNLARIESNLLKEIELTEQEAREAEARAQKQFEMLSQAGLPPEAVPPELFASMDARMGLPSGMHESIYRSQLAKNAEAARQAELEAAGKLMDVLGKVPAGQSITIGGQTYTGLSMEGIKSGIEEDASGNVTYWQVNPSTGEIVTRSLGQIGTSSGWDTKIDNNGVITRINPNTGQIEVLHDPNRPGGMVPSGGLYDVFQDGYKPSDADLKEMGLSQLVPSTGGIQCGQFVRLLSGYDGPSLSAWSAKKALVDESIGTDANPPQAGDVFVQPGGTYGHIGMVLGSTRLEDGSYSLSIVDANANGDGTIRYRTLNSRSVTGFSREGWGLQPAFQFGTDAPTSLDFTEGGDTPQNTGIINGYVEQILSGSISLENVPSDERGFVAEALNTTENRIRMSESNVATLESKVSSISEILEHDGLSSAVGTNFLSRFNPLTNTFVSGFGGESKAEYLDFISRVQQLTNQDTLDTLLNLKKAGGTLGALSGSEQKLLEDAANRINNFAITDKNGQVVGYKIDEANFKSALEEMLKATQSALEEAQVTVGTETSSYLDSYNL